MEEKIIIKSDRYSVKKIFFGFLITSVLVGLILLLLFCWMDDFSELMEEHYDEYCTEYGWGWSGGCDRSAFVCALDNLLFNGDLVWAIVFIPPMLILLVGVIFILLSKSMEIVVTDKRVYGKTYFGRVVDLPLDSVSAVGSKWFKGIAVATSSGKIAFLLIKNAREIHEEIRKLLIERQEKKEQAQTVLPTVTPVMKSGAQELKEYKELLDNGIITQEEFEAKKKQILGL